MFDKFHFKVLIKLIILVAIFLVMPTCLYYISTYIKPLSLRCSFIPIIVDFRSSISIGQYLQLISSIIFSYLLFINANKMFNLELKRDDAIIVENASIIFYSLHNNLNELLDDYSNFLRRGILNYETDYRKQSNIDIEKCFILGKMLDSNELKLLVDACRKVNRFNSISNNRENLIEDLIRQFFNPMVVEYLQYNLSNNVADWLNGDYYLLLAKLKEKISSVKIINSTKLNKDEWRVLSLDCKYTRYKGSIDNNSFYSGVEYVYDNNKMLLKLEYNCSNICSGILYNPISKDDYEHLIEDDKCRQELKLDTFFDLNIIKDNKPISGYKHSYNTAFYNHDPEVYSSNKWDTWDNLRNVEIGYYLNGKLEGFGLCICVSNGTMTVINGIFNQDSIYDGITCETAVPKHDTKVKTEHREGEVTRKSHYKKDDNFVREATFLKENLVGTGTVKSIVTGEILYEGQFDINMKYNGKGTLYEDKKIIFKGTFKDDIKITGRCYLCNDLSFKQKLSSWIEAHVNIPFFSKNNEVYYVGELNENKMVGESYFLVNNNKINIKIIDGELDVALLKSQKSKLNDSLIK